MKRPKRALLIDDNRMSIDHIESILIKWKYDVMVCENPDEGIATASHFYDVVFVDFHFAHSNLNGTMVTRQIRKNCPLLPIILMTDQGDKPTTIEHSVRGGLNSYFSKGIPGELAAERNKRLERVIQEARDDIETIHQLTFDDSECREVENRLNLLECVYKENAGKNGKIENLSEVINAAELMLKHGLTELTPANKSLLKDLRALVGPAREEAAKIKKEQGIGTTNKWAMFFKLHDARGHIETNALKTRFLLMKRPARWPLTCKHFGQVTKIVHYFCLESYTRADAPVLVSQI